MLLNARTKAELENHARQAVEIISNWSHAVKLELAAEKIYICQLKGNLNMRSPPVIRVEELCIKHDPNPKYLGVLLGKNFDPSMHIAYASAKAVAKFCSIQRVTRVRWGIAYYSKRVLYKALFKTVALYACPAWTSYAKKRHWDVLTRAQRSALLVITNAYTRLHQRTPFRYWPGSRQ